MHEQLRNRIDAYTVPMIDIIGRGNPRVFATQLCGARAAGPTMATGEQGMFGLR